MARLQFCRRCDRTIVGRPRPLVLAILLVLWPLLGGGSVEVWFFNWLRLRIAAALGVQLRQMRSVVRKRHRSWCGMCVAAVVGGVPAGALDRLMARRSRLHLHRTASTSLPAIARVPIFYICAGSGAAPGIAKALTYSSNPSRPSISFASPQDGPRDNTPAITVATAAVRLGEARTA